MAAATIEFTQVFENNTVKMGDVFLYNGHYYEIYKFKEVRLAIKGICVSGRAKRVISPFQTSANAELLKPAY